MAKLTDVSEELHPSGWEVQSSKGDPCCGTAMVLLMWYKKQRKGTLQFGVHIFSRLNLRDFTEYLIVFNVHLLLMYNLLQNN
jgi:hypothetical protein